MDKNHIKENSCVPETFVSFYERWGYRPYESELSTVAFSIALHVLSQARFTARKWLSAQNHPHSAAAKCMQSTLQGMYAVHDFFYSLYTGNTYQLRYHPAFCSNEVKRF